MLLIGEKTFMKETKYFLFIYFLEFQLSFVYFMHISPLYIYNFTIRQFLFTYQITLVSFKAIQY